MKDYTLKYGKGSVTFATGMAALAAIFTTLLRRGDHLVSSQFVFGNTNSLFGTLQELGVEITFVDATDSSQVRAAIQPNTRMVFTETIANPGTQVADLAVIGERPAERRRLKGAAPLEEQGFAEALFQHGERARDGGLGKAEQRRALGDAARPDDGGKLDQVALVYLHNDPLYSCRTKSSMPMPRLATVSSRLEETAWPSLSIPSPPRRCFPGGLQPLERGRCGRR